MKIGKGAAKRAVQIQPTALLRRRSSWAVTLDVIPIIVFALFYIFLANRDFWGWSPQASFAGMLLYLPFAALTGQLFAELPFFRISAGYWSLPLVIGLYALALAARDRTLSRNLFLGAGLLCVSLAFRSFDELVCTALPLGTHFTWHILNAIMLGWMIETWRRQRPATSER